MLLVSNQISFIPYESLKDKDVRSNIMNSVILYLRVRSILNLIGIALKWFMFFLICQLICGLSKIQELMVLNSKGL